MGSVAGMPQPLTTVVLATHNAKKLAELRRIADAAGAGLQVVGLDEVGSYPEPAETEATFEGNALIKARAAAAATGLAALADDSGLEVDVLNGMPGVRTARWAGARASDEENRRLVLAQVDDVPDPLRTARFVCAMALVMPDGSEHVIEAAGPDTAWTILRPSVVFGRGDSFLNLFADLARMFPVLPLTGASCRFQPVYVEDVAEAVYQSLTRPDAAGQTFELAGPTVYTLRQLVEYVSALIGKLRPVLGLPEGIGMVQARLMELAPQPLMSRDNVRSMRVDNVASGEPQPFGLTPTALEAVAPGWLGTAGPRAFYYPFRRHARR